MSVYNIKCTNCYSNLTTAYSIAKTVVAYNIIPSCRLLLARAAGFHKHGHYGMFEVDGGHCNGVACITQSDNRHFLM